MTRDAGGGKSTEERLQLQREVGAECCGGGTAGSTKGYATQEEGTSVGTPRGESG